MKLLSALYTMLIIQRIWVEGNTNYLSGSMNKSKNIVSIKEDAFLL